MEGLERLHAKERPNQEATPSKWVSLTAPLILWPNLTSEVPVSLGKSSAFFCPLHPDQPVDRQVLNAVRSISFFEAENLFGLFSGQRGFTHKKSYSSVVPPKRRPPFYPKPTGTCAAVVLRRISLSDP